MKAGSIEKGTYLLWKGYPYQVVDREFMNPGKGSAFVRCKMKNLKTGQVLRETIKTNDEVETTSVEDRDAQFLFAAGASYTFMDGENFEQFSIDEDVLGEKVNYLFPGQNYRLVFWGSEVVGLHLPPKIKLRVSDAPEALKGDTVSGATKLVSCETGLQVKVPLFIKTDDVILVNTETGEYVERANR